MAEGTLTPLAKAGPRLPVPEVAKDGHHHSPLRALAERAISISSMDWRVRVVTAVVACQGLLVAAMLVFHGRSLGLMNVTTVHNQLVRMPALIFWTCLVFAVLAWTYLLGGSFHGHLVLRPFALGVFLFTTRPLWDIAARITPLSQGVTVACLAGLAMLGAGTWVLDLINRRRGEPRLAHHHRLRPLTVALTALLVAGVFLAPWWGGVSRHAPLLFTQSFYNHLYVLTDFLVPMLLLTAVDFTDVAYTGSQLLTRAAGRLRPPYVVAGAVALLGLGSVAWLLEINPRHPFPATIFWAGDLELLAYGAVLGGLAVLLVRRASRGSGGWDRVPYLAIAGAAVLAYGVNYLALQIVLPRVIDTRAGVTSTGTYLTTYSHDQAPRFTIAYPSTWEVKAQEPATPDALGLYTFNGLQTGLSGQFWIVVLKTADSGEDAVAASAKALVQGLNGSLGGDIVAAGPWQKGEFTLNSNAVRSRFWARQDRGYFWMLMGLANQAGFDLASPTFDQIVASWRAEATPGAAGSSSAPDTEPIVERVSRWMAVGQAVFWLLVAALAGLLLATRRRWRSPVLPAALTFAVVFGVMSFGPYLHQLAGAVAGLVHRPHGKYPHSYGAWGVMWTLALGALATVAFWAVRRRTDPRWARLLGMLLILQLAVAAITLMYWGSGREIEATGQFPLLAALVIILALAWDVVMSGDAITNRHSVHFPRHTRVMLLMGYEMMVSTAVLFLSSLETQSSGAAVTSLFESDRYPQLGLFQLALPVVVALFFVQLAGWMRSGRRPVGESLPLG